MYIIYIIYIYIYIIYNIYMTCIYNIYIIYTLYIYIYIYIYIKQFTIQFLFCNFVTYLGYRHNNNCFSATMLPSTIVLTSQAWSALIDAHAQYFLLQIEGKANIALISFYYCYNIRIADPNASLDTTVHYLSLIFTFFEVCIAQLKIHK